MVCYRAAASTTRAFASARRASPRSRSRIGGGLLGRIPLPRSASIAASRSVSARSRSRSVRRTFPA